MNIRGFLILKKIFGQAIALLYTPCGQGIALLIVHIFLLFTYSWTSFVCEHNVSYKGQAQLNNVAFMGHYDMALHIMMESSYILYAL